MLKNLATALLILIVVVFVYVSCNSYAARRHVISNEVYGGTGSGTAGSGASRTEPTADRGLPPTSPTGEAATTSPEVTSQGTRAEGSMVPPPADSIQPDPPNGMRFAGGGHYQLYRQGNLTWRLNTDTGVTCIIFATEEEWRKPQVARSGCRGR